MYTQQELNFNNGKYFTANSLAQLSSLLEEFTTPTTGEARKDIVAISDNAQHRICFVSSDLKS
jgi:hypothetical protein